jgi:hypothetical protein
MNQEQAAWKAAANFGVLLIVWDDNWLIMEFACLSTPGRRR